METMKIYHEVMASSELIALATSINNQPNVRVVNFISSKESGKIYFASFKDNQKVKEFKANDTVAFTTIPFSNTGHVRVHHCKVKLSNKSIYDLEDQFVSKLPTYKEIIDLAGEDLDVYELAFNEATVTLDVKNSQVIHF